MACTKHFFVMACSSGFFFFLVCLFVCFLRLYLRCVFGEVKGSICNWHSCTETYVDWGKNTAIVEFEINVMKVKSTVPLLSGVSLHLMIMQQVTLAVKVNLVYTHLDHLHRVRENPGWYRKKCQDFVNNPSHCVSWRPSGCVCSGSWVPSADSSLHPQHLLLEETIHFKECGILNTKCTFWSVLVLWS